jgi:glycerol kinase
MQVGLYPGLEEFAQTWALDRKFTPDMDEDTRARKYDAWKRAVNATLSF